jgi:hypothetical protein
MNRLPVSSSSIISVGYDQALNVLEVEFVGGGVYQYHGVPPETFQELLSAESLGKYVNQIIKKRNYPFDRIA